MAHCEIFTLHHFDARRSDVTSCCVGDLSTWRHRKICLKQRFNRSLPFDPVHGTAHVEEIPEGTPRVGRLE